MLTRYLLILLIVCMTRKAYAIETVIIGDSLGQGVAMAAGLDKNAALGVQIRGSKAVAQLNATPPGSTAFLVLGTNDAIGSVDKLEKHIDAILDAAMRRNIKLIWVGPPCVQKAWDERSKTLDAMLERKLSSRSFRYVSLRDEKICSFDMHANDGVHLTMAGYAYIWNKARNAAGLPANTVLTSARIANTERPKSEPRMDGKQTSQQVENIVRQEPIRRPKREDKVSTFFNRTDGS